MELFYFEAGSLKKQPEKAPASSGEKENTAVENGDNAVQKPLIDTV